MRTSVNAPLANLYGYGERLKILLWDGDGYILWYKRLEEGVFKLPAVNNNAQSVELRPSELAMMLDGIDLKSVRRVKRYRRESLMRQ